MSEKNYCDDSDILRMKNFHRNINTIFNATSTVEYKNNNNDIIDAISYNMYQASDDEKTSHIRAIVLPLKI